MPAHKCVPYLSPPSLHVERLSSTPMNRCLQAPEILRLICDELPSEWAEERQRILAVALSCRALLEPALDRLWRNIPTFEFLRCTLPPDVWKLERISIKHKDSIRKYQEQYGYNLLCLQRAITSSDLARYITYYAPRIREVSIRNANFTLSSEAWHSLHLAVNWQPGALAPHAVSIQWALAPPSEHLIPPEVLNQAWPYFALFLGPTASSLAFEFRSDSPIQVASLRNAAQHSNVKHLYMRNRAQADPNTTFLDSYIQSFPWTHLQTLRLTILDGNSIDHLSTLPALKSLAVDGLNDVKRLHEYENTDDFTRPEYISFLSAEAFVSLEELDLSSEKITSISGVLQRIPPHNRIHTLRCEIDDAMRHRAEFQELMATMKYHCNRETLRNLTVDDSTCPYEWEEDTDIDSNPVVDISPFFEFGLLERVIFKLSESVCPTPEDITRIIASWPNLTALSIDLGFPNSRLPLLDHIDCMKLLYGCHRLEKLGLYFNASLITGRDPIPVSLLCPNEDPKPAALIWLEVGASPIYSPSKVTEFLRKHCPSLFRSQPRLDYASTDDVRANVFNVMYEERWLQVSKNLRRGHS